MIRATAPRVAVPLMAVLLLLAGCATPTSATPAGGSANPLTTPTAAGTSPTAAPATADACAIVTEADITSALGFDPGSGTGTTNFGATSCTFGNYPEMVTVNLAPTATRAGYDRLHVPPTVGTLVELSGLGDAAFGVLNAPVATVEFLRGDAVVAIVIVQDGSMDKAVALAKVANSRL